MLLIITVLFPIVIFPLSGIDTTRIPDVLFYYSPNRLVELLQSYTAAERSAYYLGAFLIDVLYPLAYSKLLAGLLKNLLNKRIAKQSSWNYLCLLPFAAAFFDLLENATVSILLSSIGQPSYTLATAAALFTPLKWGLVFINILLIIILFVINMFIMRTKGEFTKDNNKN